MHGRSPTWASRVCSLPGGGCQMRSPPGSETGGAAAAAPPPRARLPGDEPAGLLPPVRLPEEAGAGGDAAACWCCCRVARASAEGMARLRLPCPVPLPGWRGLRALPRLGPADASPSAAGAAAGAGGPAPEASWAAGATPSSSLLPRILSGSVHNNVVHTPLLLAVYMGQSSVHGFVCGMHGGEHTLSGIVLVHRCCDAACILQQRAGLIPGQGRPDYGAQLAAR